MLKQADLKHAEQADLKHAEQADLKHAEQADLDGDGIGNSAVLAQSIPESPAETIDSTVASPFVLPRPGDVARGRLVGSLAELPVEPERTRRLGPLTPG